MKIGVSVPLNTNQPIHKHWFLLLFAFLFVFTSQPHTRSPSSLNVWKCQFFEVKAGWWGEEEEALTTTKANNGRGICRWSWIAKVASRLLKWRSQEINWRRLKSVFPYHLSTMWLIYSNISYTTKCEISDFFIATSLSSCEEFKSGLFLINDSSTEAETTSKHLLDRENQSDRDF